MYSPVREMSSPDELAGHLGREGRKCSPGRTFLRIHKKKHISGGLSLPEISKIKKERDKGGLYVKPGLAFSGLRLMFDVWLRLRSEK